MIAWLLLACSGPPAPVPDAVPPLPCGPDGGADGCLVAVPDTQPPLWIARTELSVGRWRACVAAGACEGTVAGSDDLAASGLSWAQATAACAWSGHRLPTEDEWARAAGGDPPRIFPWGEGRWCEPLDPSFVRRVQLEAQRVAAWCQQVATGAADVGPVSDRLRAMCADPTAHHPADVVAEERRVRGELPLPDGPCTADGVSPAQPVVQVPHPLGLQGLGGNVREWTASAEGDARVVRGGSWLATTPDDQVVATRVALPPDLALPDVGVRCAWSPP